jgi:23S rRNA (cytidine1920-2'-O)/16S rRNA (cytidine1409-2'-O)-methyltransferase
MSIRLDEALVKVGLSATRSQAENYIKLGLVTVDEKVVKKAGSRVNPTAKLRIVEQQYVSRAALKLASAADVLGINFDKKIVLDVGSSTGGFTEYALRQGAKKVIAVDVGTDQMHPSLSQDERVDLHEKTDIRNFTPAETPQVILIDVSFISLREIMPCIRQLADKDTQIVAMLKPQFEAGKKDINKGVIKNDTVRRRIVRDFENWVKDRFIVIAKADSSVAGGKGNIERFYLLKKTS